MSLAPVRRAIFNKRSIWATASSYDALIAAIKSQKIQGGDIPCTRQDINTEWWFNEEKYYEDRAKRLCQICPVITECARHALRNDEVGVWGGMTRYDRHRIRRESSLAPPL